MQLKRIGDKTLATEFKHRITIQEKTLVADNEGGFVETWADRETVYASISPMTAKQIFDYKSIGVDATHIIKVRGDINIRTTAL